MRIPIGSVCRRTRETRLRAVTAGVVAVLLILPQYALADSYAGSDWLVNLTGHLNAPISALSQDITENSVPTTIGQTTASDIDIPLSISALSLIVDVPGTVSGSHITALLFYTNIASLSASGPNTCQQRVISCKR